jgi:type III restriction enzyme
LSKVVIENPIINSPFEEPSRHFRFDDDGITDEVVGGRRRSQYFMPIPASKKRAGAQSELVFEEWTQDRVEENTFINEVRERVDRWRQMRWPNVTAVTRRLLEYWTDRGRERPLFFCQVEALETAIFLAEAAGKESGGAYFQNEIRRFNEDANPGLFRVAHKMATGTGKTVLMAMVIAWQTLNKAANPQDGRFSDAFLIVCPGITIRDRLRVVLPSDPNNYFRERDLVPPELRDDLGRAKVIITNFHAFRRRETVKAAKVTKEILGGKADAAGVFTETPDQMVRRVCRELGSKRNIVVINDEAHHCYRRKPDVVEDVLAGLKGDDKAEAVQRDEEARVWISGLEAVAGKVGVRTVYDLSATPFFLKGSGYPEGTLFPWVVSDFSLIDAIEAGLVKIPRWTTTPRGRVRPTAVFGSASGTTSQRRAGAPTHSTRRRDSQRRWRALSTACTRTTRRRSRGGALVMTWGEGRQARHRSLSSCATTPPCRRWLSTTSPAGARRRLTGARRSSPVSSTCSATWSMADGPGAAGPSWWTPASWSRATR